MGRFSPSPRALVMAGVVALVASAPALGQESVPPANCTAPAIPDQFTDEAHQDRFTGAVQAYQLCVKTYVAARQAAMAAHAQAGNNAASGFNAFAAKVAAIKPPPAR